MPATYSHRHTYEQITGRGRNTWKKPEPPPKPKTRQYFILGMEVDYNTYREYSYEKKWTIDGDVLKGFTVTLWSLEHYATEEHAKDYPIEAANARKILDQIRAEITSKGENTVKNPETAADYISALNDIYLESRSAYDTLHKKEEAAKVKMDQAYDDMRDPACSNRQMAEALYTVAKGEHQLAEEERRNEYSKLMKAHQVKVDELRTKFADHLGDRYAASPDKMDAATMQLLNAGVCNASDLARLSDRFADNPTMLRILGSFARKLSDDRLLSNKDRKLLSVVKHKAATADGSYEMRLFEEAVSAANYGLGKDYAHATNMHNVIVAGALEEYRQRMAGSIIGTTEE